MKTLFIVAVSLAIGVAAFLSLRPAQPPIIVRFSLSPDESKVHLTNTSDKVLHGVTLTTETDGKKASRVIVDTIEPHKTADLAFHVDFLLEPTLTCKDHTKPLLIPIPNVPK
jgi:hypothetical protein